MFSQSEKTLKIHKDKERLKRLCKDRKDGNRAIVISFLRVFGNLSDKGNLEEVRIKLNK
jgi:hypothetical protein